jgi:superoxide dismutase, Fe-Mn family
MQQLFKSAFIAIFTISSFVVLAQHSQTPLPYATDALEPHIDKMTMEIHYGRHHKAYIDNLNKALADKPEASLSLDELMKKITKETPSAIRNNGGGHWNHTFFWSILGAAKGTMPKGALADAINRDFGSLDNLKKKFKDASLARFGSGWTWIIVKEGKLVIMSTANQDNPLMAAIENQGTPIAALDVWEHAYYLKYQNKRADYVDAFWNVINWDKVAELHAAVK